MYAAGALVFNTDFDFYFFKRKGDNGLSLPMGKCEGEETPKQTCVREVLEETGLEIDILDDHPFIRKGDKDFPYPCYTYLGLVIGGKNPPTHKHEGDVVVTKNIYDLLSGPFSDYNNKMINYFFKHLLLKIL